MYESKVTFSLPGWTKPQWLLVSTESHPEDIANDIMQSIVYDQIMDTRGVTYKDIKIVKVEYQGGGKLAPVKGKKGQYSVTMDIGPMDFPMLRRQKRVLVQMADKARNNKETDALEGIINFLDHIQDTAVQAGVPEAFVFGKKK